MKAATFIKIVPLHLLYALYSVYYTLYIYIYILCVQYTLHYELRATRWKCLTKFGLKNRGESGSFLKTSIVVNIGLNTLLYYSVYYLLYVYCILQAARSGQKIVDQISFQNGASDFTHWQPPLWRSPQLYCVIYFRHCIIHIILFIHLCIYLFSYVCFLLQAARSAKKILTKFDLFSRSLLFVFRDHTLAPAA